MGRQGRPTCNSKQCLCFSEICLRRASFSFSRLSRHKEPQSNFSSSHRDLSWNPNSVLTLLNTKKKIKNKKNIESNLAAAAVSHQQHAVISKWSHVSLKLFGLLFQLMVVGRYLLLGLQQVLRSESFHSQLITHKHKNVITFQHGRQERPWWRHGRICVMYLQPRNYTTQRYIEGRAS